MAHFTVTFGEEVLRVNAPSSEEALRHARIVQERRLTDVRAENVRRRKIRPMPDMLPEPKVLDPELM